MLGVNTLTISRPLITLHARSYHVSLRTRFAAVREHFSVRPVDGAAVDWSEEGASLEMAIRYLKILLALSLGVYCLMDGTQNLINFERGHDWLVYVTSMKDHKVYPSSIGPAVTSPFWTYALWIWNIVAQFISGLLALKGVLDMWLKRMEDAVEFKAAKTFAILGAGSAVLLWFGFYFAILGGYFSMWQTEWGSGTLSAAAAIAGLSGLLMVFLNMPDQ